MKFSARFKYPEEYKVIVRDSYNEYTYYGLDDFDCKYIRILQSKFGCINSFHTIPDRIKLELSPFAWKEEWNMFVLDEYNPQLVQLNRLEYMMVSHSNYDELMKFSQNYN